MNKPEPCVICGGPPHLSTDRGHLYLTGEGYAALEQGYAKWMRYFADQHFGEPQ